MKKISAYMGIILRIILFTAMSGISGQLIHVVNSIIEGIHGKPDFVTVPFTIYCIVNKVLFAIGYLIIGYKIPIKNKLLRAFVYIMLIWLSDFMPQVLGLTGGDGKIVESALSLSIFIMDSLSYIIDGILLGLIFRSFPDTFTKPCRRAVLISTCTASAVIFPITVILVEQLFGAVYPACRSNIALGISEDKKIQFLIVFYSFFIVTGAVLPLFYRLTEYNSTSKTGWFKFYLVYTLCMWLPIVYIMVFFGTKVIPTLVYAVIFIIALFIITFINSRLLSRE